MSLVERIRRGEIAIAAAKAQGRDVSDWEEHLARLKREAELQQLAATVLPENQPDEVNQIVEIWRRLFGIDLESVRRRDSRIPESLKPVVAHLAFLRKVGT
jgi:uncharacterized protein YmfQ (DUF2313 family)